MRSILEAPAAFSDDLDLADKLQLELEGCLVRTAADGETGLAIAGAEDPARAEGLDSLISIPDRATNCASVLVINMSTCLKIQQVRAAVTDVSVRHTHDSSWPESIDWVDLRNHLVKGHGEREDDIDDFESYEDRTTGRRRHAEERHQALHLGPLPATSG